MPNFCVNCGSPLSSGPFCVKCGAGARGVIPPAQPQAAPVTVQPTSPQASPVPTSPGSNQGLGPLAKLCIAAVAMIFVGGAAAAGSLYYVAHRVSQRVHQATDRILGSSSESGESDSGSIGSSSATSSSRSSKSNVCRLLSKEEVSRAIGVEIIRADPGDNACS